MVNALTSRGKTNLGGGLSHFWWLDHKGCENGLVCVAEAPLVSLRDTFKKASNAHSVRAACSLASSSSLPPACSDVLTDLHMHVKTVSQQSVCDRITREPFRHVALDRAHQPGGLM